MEGDWSEVIDEQTEEALANDSPASAIDQIPPVSPFVRQNHTGNGSKPFPLGFFFPLKYNLKQSKEKLSILQIHRRIKMSMTASSFLIYDEMKGYPVQLEEKII